MLIHLSAKQDLQRAVFFSNWRSGYLQCSAWKTIEFFHHQALFHSPAPNKTSSENLRILRAPNQGLQETIRFVYSGIDIWTSVTWNGKKTIKGASISHHGPFLVLAVLLLAILLLNKPLNLHFTSLAKGLQETIAVLAWIQTNRRIKVLWKPYTKADTARNCGSVRRWHTYVTSLVGLETTGWSHQTEQVPLLLGYTWTTTSPTLPLKSTRKVKQRSANSALH